MPASNTEQLMRIGGQLGQYVRSQSGQCPSPGALQGVIADLAGSVPDLQAPLRDLVSRQTFTALLPHALSAGGLIQRDALIQEISRVYNADILLKVELVLNGFLDASGGIAVSISQVSTPYDRPIIDEPSVINTAASVMNDMVTITPNKLTIPKTNAATYWDKLKPVHKLVIFSVGTSALIATGFASLISGKSCSQISDTLEPLAADSSEFKTLINENKQKCANDSRFLIQNAILLDNVNSQPRQALELINKSIAIDPNNSNAYLYKGIFLYNLYDFKMSLAAYNRAIEIDPKNQFAYTGKGDALQSLARYNEAIAFYTKAIELDPFSSYAFHGRGDSRFSLKNYTAGLEDLNKSIQLDSASSNAYKTRAYIKTWLDDKVGACTDIKKAKQLGMKETYDDNKKVSIDQVISNICN